MCLDLQNSRAVVANALHAHTCLFSTQFCHTSWVQGRFPLELWRHSSPLSSQMVGLPECSCTEAPPSGQNTLCGIAVPISGRSSASWSIGGGIAVPLVAEAPLPSCRESRVVTQHCEDELFHAPHPRLAAETSQGFCKSGTSCTMLPARTWPRQVPGVHLRSELYHASSVLHDIST